MAHIRQSRPDSGGGFQIENVLSCAFLARKRTADSIYVWRVSDTNRGANASSPSRFYSTASAFELSFLVWGHLGELQKRYEVRVPPNLRDLETYSG